MWKLAMGFGAVALTLCLATGASFAAKPGGHPGGSGHGGGGHPGGGAHFSAPHVSAPHFSAAHIGGSHFNAGHAVARATPHVSHFSVSHASHVARPSFAARSRLTHATPSARTSAHSLATTAHPLTAGAHAFPNARAAAFHADPRTFAAHRHFAGDPAFRPFLGRGWHPYGHLGWVGPVFWPYAYGDFFYYALWPYDYDVDPFWAYGYGDIYQAIFSPYDYGDYVQGPGAPARMATLTQGMAQSCADEAAEVTGWPLDQIQAAIQPNDQQSALLDGLGNALVKASDEVKAHCPTTVSFAPTARLGAMQQRLQALADAVNIVGPPLDKFYASLSDEQKARFNDIAPPAPPQQANAPKGQPGTPNLQAQCNASVMAWPTDQVDRVVHPNDAQRAKLAALQSAAVQAADTIKAACPTELPVTPPDRLAAIGKRLDAMLQAVDTVQPALADFYDALSDEQKAHFDGMGRQLFAANQE
jgi:hypothetical protein